jgi:fructose-specific PTS system IIA-like component
VPYLNLPLEANPFLGYRAVRFYEEQHALVATQLRAILRAAALGNVQLMVPMVSCVEEVRLVKSMIARAKAVLDEAGTPHGEVELGIMVEVPSVAFSIPQLSEEVSFFSIGTNDLTQYTLAVDRGNRKVARLYNNLHPAFLAMLKKVVDDAHTCGRWVGMCGEMGGIERFAPVLVGLGLDEISTAGPNVPAMKAAVAGCDSKACRTLIESAVTQSTIADVEGLLSDYAASGQQAGTLDEAITNLSSDARSREEAIKEMVDSLFLAGRATNPDTVEEAIWLREDVFSTGIGHGFAIPHCKSPDITVNSVGVLRLKKPIDWQKTLDDQPVRILLMLAIRESDGADEHLKIFAKLARKIMHEEFRERLLTESDPAALVQYIEGEIQ